MAASPTWRSALCPGGPDSVRRPVAWLIAAVLALLSGAHIEVAAAQARFEVRSAYIEPAEGVYELNATLNFDLPEFLPELLPRQVLSCSSPGAALASDQASLGRAMRRASRRPSDDLSCNVNPRKMPKRNPATRGVKP